MTELRQFRQFIAVAEELHFRRAAQRLNMSQPPLTAAIRKLEREIGAELIERGNRTVGLTAAGIVFLTEARRAVAQADRAMAAAREAVGGRTGTVRLSCVGSALYGRLPGELRRFRRANPAIRLELREATSQQQVELLRREEVDIGVVIPPLPEAGELTLMEFDRDQLVIALPREHPLAARKNVLLNEISNEPFVLWPASQGRGFYSRIIRICAEEGFVPHVVQEAHQMQAVLSLVAVGEGVSIVPASLRALRAEDVVYRPIASAHVEFALSLCWRDQPPAPVVGRLIEFVRDERDTLPVS